MADLDRLLLPDISYAASQAVDVPDFARIQRRAAQRRRTRAALGAAAAAVVAVAVAVGASMTAGTDRTAPPAHDPTSTTGRVPPTPVTAPLRPDADWPVLLTSGGTGDCEHGWASGSSSVDLADIDIQAVGSACGGRLLEWRLYLRSTSGPASTTAPVGQSTEYGLMVDVDGNRLADCQIGISTDAPAARAFRVWVKNLTTGHVNERVGGPYGFPFDFVHPFEGGGSRTMVFFFLEGTRPDPCGAFTETANFYAYASVVEGGRVTAVDYAPEAAWLRMRPS
jgi:hypothetical protein